ncbi:hypothetical protein [Pseudofrankia saprophytica]|uniref:hypothetical protein n=1 Tax=Pseudofrankia saprophytica TaxID=298655 RepID=UPI0002D7703D|nr:hypothetical protein [Pseudofrankia saprophytica]
MVRPGARALGRRARVVGEGRLVGQADTLGASRGDGDGDGARARSVGIGRDRLRDRGGPGEQVRPGGRAAR